MAKRNFIKKLMCFVLAGVLLVQGGMVSHAEEVESGPMSQPGEVYSYHAGNQHSWAFFIPTQVYNFGGEFYLADAYNHQILHTDNVRNAPEGWYPVGMGLNRPHAIASDGTIFLALDTDNNRVVTYAKTDAGYQLIESIENVGIRPHYTVYDKATGQFYVWSSMTGTMYIYKRAKNSMSLVLKSARQIKDLDGCYTRSFTIDGGMIYFPCVAKGAIYAVKKSNFKVVGVYPVVSDLTEMVQVLHIQDYYYLVTSRDGYTDKPARLVRATSLAGFGNGSYEDILNQFGEIDGIPYYITQGEDSHFYAPVIEGSGKDYICSFEIQGNQIMNVEHFKY